MHDEEIVLQKSYYLELLQQISENNLQSDNKNLIASFDILNASLNIAEGVEYNANCISNFLSFISVEHLIVYWTPPRQLPLIISESLLTRPIGNIRNPELLDMDIFSGNQFDRDNYSVYPIMIENRLSSVLILNKNTVPDGLQQLIQLISRITLQSGIIFEQAAFALNTTQTQLYTDSLMRIRNRTCLEVEQSSYSPMHVAFLDVDKFKSFNDNYGHEYGDHILREYGSILASLTNRNVTPYRFAGDEVVILSDNESKLREFLEKLREILKTSKFTLNGITTGITVSIGVALNAKNIETGSAWADYAMYQVKKEGRNGIKFLQTQDTVPKVVKDKEGDDR